MSSSNTRSWSKKHYAWLYALFINVAIILYSTVLYLLDIYQTAGFRAMYLLFILVGLVMLVWNYSKNNPSTTYLEAFLLCAKTGLYFLLIMLPIALIFLLLNPDAVQLVQVMETHTPDFNIQEIVGMLFFEMVPSIILSGIAASFLSGWNSPKS